MTRFRPRGDIVAWAQRYDGKPMVMPVLPAPAAAVMLCALVRDAKELVGCISAADVAEVLAATPRLGDVLWFLIPKHVVARQPH